MKVNFLCRVLDKMGRKTVASSSKSRKLRVESLENRELLDAAGLNVVSLPPACVAEKGAEFLSEQVVDQSIDLVNLTNEASKANEALTIDAPTVLELGDYNVETENLPMKWTEVDDAIGYRVEYTVDGGKSWKKGAEVAGDVTSRMASKVRTDMEYIFRVRAFNETSVSEWTYSEPFYYTASIPKAPDKFRLGEFDSSAMKLSMDWDKVAYVDGYRIQYSMDGGATWYNSETLKGEDSTSRVAWKVHTDREYQFRVCSYNDVGSSNWTYSDKFHVNYAELANPDSFEIGEYNASTRTLATSWSAVENASGYEVQYSLDRGRTWRLAEKLHTGGETSRMASSVVPGTEYEFRVRAYNAIGMSDWTYSELYTPPALLTAPAFAEVYSYNPATRRAVLSWGDVDDETGYRIEYSTNSGETWISAFKTEADVTKGAIDEIKPNVFYTFRVRAHNETDVSPWVEIPFYYSETAYAEIGASKIIY